MKYLHLINEKLLTIKKGTSVFFPEVMDTLKNLFLTILNPDDKKLVKEWQIYISKNGEIDFWNIFKGNHLKTNFRDLYSYGKAFKDVKI